jgi:hypothetical protein
VVASAVATFIIPGQMNFLEYRDYVLRSAKEQVFIASQLRANRKRDLQSRAEANLPGIVLAYSRRQETSKCCRCAFRIAPGNDIYELNSIPVPAEIFWILNEIPPALTIKSNEISHERDKNHRN